jgi:hypothetical protein
VWIVDPAGDVTKVKFPDRIGRLFDVAKSADGSIVICGSIGPPMHLLPSPRPSDGVASMPDRRLIVGRYPADLLLPLFTREPWRTYLLVLVRRFGDLTSAGAVGNLIAFLPDLDPDATA